MKELSRTAVRAILDILKDGHARGTSLGCMWVRGRHAYVANRCEIVRYRLDIPERALQLEAEMQCIDYTALERWYKLAGARDVLDLSNTDLWSVSTPAMQKPSVINTVDQIRRIFTETVNGEGPVDSLMRISPTRLMTLSKALGIDKNDGVCLTRSKARISNGPDMFIVRGVEAADQDPDTAVLVGMLPK